MLFSQLSWATTPFWLLLKGDYKTAVCIQQGFTVPSSAHPLPGLAHSEPLQCSLPCGFQRNTDALPSPLETYYLERSSLLPPRPLTSHHEDPPSGSWVLGFLWRKRSLCVHQTAAHSCGPCGKQSPRCLDVPRHLFGQRSPSWQGRKEEKQRPWKPAPRSELFTIDRQQSIPSFQSASLIFHRLSTSPQNKPCQQ